MTVIIISFLVAIVFFIVSGYVFTKEYAPLSLFTICLGIIFLGISGSMLEDKGMKEGQIDALTGKRYYELKTNPDSTKEWVLIQKK